jgi:hypothetical protein
MADNKPMTKREKEALDRENSGDKDKTREIVAGRGILAQLRAEANRWGK